MGTRVLQRAVGLVYRHLPIRRLVGSSRQIGRNEPTQGKDNTVKIYNFSQSNSGGWYGKPALEVFVAAGNEEEAWALLQEHATLSECECCGPRWPYAEEIEAGDLFDEVRHQIRKREEWHARGATGREGQPIIALITRDGIITGNSAEEL